MADINIKGRYRMYTHDGTESFDFTTYANNLCVIRRPNENTFVTVRQYVPGPGAKPFTTFEPGSSYTISTKTNDSVFSMGPYTRSDRLPSSTTIKSPIFYIGLDRNSIPVPLSSYTLGVNSPLSTFRTTEANLNGFYTNFTTFDASSFKIGFNQGFTHLQPGSSYELRNRVPFTLFAPLKSEMGDGFAIGNNSGGEYGMGHRYSHRINYSTSPFYKEQIYGLWDKIVFQSYLSFNTDTSVTWNNLTINSLSMAALSTCGDNKILFVRGNNKYGQLGTGSTQEYYPTWTRLNGFWNDVDMGNRHMIAINSQGHLYGCGSNQYGQLGLGQATVSTNTLTLIDNSKTYIQLAVKVNSTMVRDSNGYIYGCGGNGNGQLGIGNTTSSIFNLTQEQSQQSWTSLYQIQYTTSFNTSNTVSVAIRDKKLYGSGINFEYIYGLPEGGGSSIFLRESLSSTDITNCFVSRSGTFIQRENQPVYFAAGNNNRACLDAVSGNYALEGVPSYSIPFTRTSIPSTAKKIFRQGTTDLTWYTLGYIDQNYNLWGKSLSSFGSFTNIEEQFFDVFLEDRLGTAIYLSAGSQFRPSPTPTPTLTRTPTPTPTTSPLPSFPPLNRVVVGYQKANGDPAIRAITFTDSGNGINTNQTPEINFNDYSGNFIYGMDIQKNSIQFPDKNNDNLYRVRLFPASNSRDIKYSTNCTTLISPSVGTISNEWQGVDIEFNILPYNSFYEGYPLIIGYGKDTGPNQDGTYVEGTYIINDSGTVNTLFNPTTRNYVNFPLNNNIRILIKHAPSCYRNNNLIHATLIQSNGDTSNPPGGFAEPIFDGNINDSGSNNTAPGQRIRRIQNQQDEDLANYKIHNFTYSRRSIPYVIIVNTQQQVLLYSPNFVNGSQSTQNPWTQLFKFTDTNIPIVGGTTGTFSGDPNGVRIGSNISCADIVFDRNDPNILYYSYPLYTDNITSKSGYHGGIAVGSYNLITGVRSNRNALKVNSWGNYSADVNSLLAGTPNGRTPGHKLVVDNNNDLWLFAFETKAFTSSPPTPSAPNRLYLLKFNKNSNVWQQIKYVDLTQSLTSMIPNDLLYLCIK